MRRALSPSMAARDSRPDDVGERDRADERAIDKHEHDRLALLGEAADFGAVDLHAHPSQMAGADHPNLAPLDDCLRPLAGDVAEVAHRLCLETTLLRRAHDASCDRMLGLALQRCREGEDLVLLKRAERHDVGHPEAAFGERTGLVEDDRIEASSALEGGAVADQEAVLGSEAGADRNHQRHGEPERMRAGDDHDRHHALDRERDLGTERQPGEERRRRRPRARSR